jgi:hypothetical protein
MRTGHYSGPYDLAKLEALIGPFWTALLGCIVKADGTPHTIQDLSFCSALHPAVNADIDSGDLLCEWGTFAIMYLLVLFAPPGSEAATLDVDAAYRRCPVCADQQHHFVVSWGGKVFVDNCIAFGRASLAGVFGQVADAFLAICHAQGWSPCTKWVNDFVFIRHLLGTASTASLDFAFGLEAILQLSLDLGWPWKASKTKPFSQVFQYLGFQWLLLDHSVSIPKEKKPKYLACLALWTAGTRLLRQEAKVMHSTLVHCALALPDARSHLVFLSHFAAALSSAASSFTCWLPSPPLLSSIVFWREALHHPFCGLLLRKPPPAVPTELWVNASTLFGIGTVFDGQWQAWQLAPGWKVDSRNIGWAKMLAIELDLRLALARGFWDTHFLIRSNNMGVTGALKARRSRNLEQNRILQCIAVLMRANGLWVTLLYVTSATNLSDRLLRGLPAVDRPCSSTPVPIPHCLVPVLVRI